MATITTGINEGRKAGVKGLKRHHPRTDMTPMVDLGFLLITFFVITTQLSQPYTTPLYMPKDGKPMPTGESTALTVLLGKDDQVYYYEGQYDQALAQNAIRKVPFGGDNSIGHVIMEKQRRMDEAGGNFNRDMLMLMIKAGPEAHYENVVKMMDEAIIHRVKRYAIVGPEKTETGWLSQQQ
mgnify:CR=1 FL=1